MMRLILSVVALVFLVLLGCGNSSQSAATVASGPAKIEVSCAGAPAGTAYLIGTIDQRRFRIDSTQADANGSLTFAKATPYPTGFYFAVYQDNTAIQLLLDEDQEFQLITNKQDIAGQMAVSGSLANELLYNSLRFEADIQPRFTQANSRVSAATPGTAEYDSAKAAQNALVQDRTNFLNQIFTEHPNNFFVRFKRAGQNPAIRSELTLPDGSPDNTAQIFHYRRDLWENVDFSDSSLLRTPVIANKLERYFDQLTPKNPDSIIASADFLLDKVISEPEYLRFFANWITLRFEPGKTDLMDSEAVYVHMIQNYFTPELAFWSDTMTVYGLQQRAGEMANSLVGRQGPNITVPGLDGQAHTLYDEDAPYLVVYMYNPTCEHCMAETPPLRDLVQARNDIDVFAIAIDTDEDAWRGFVHQYDIQAWTNVYDPTNRSIYGQYYVDVTPELYLLNPERIIIGKNLKPSQVSQVIERDRAKRN
ncbi:MAG: thioredoxin-like domain-containing protein [Bacteroidota bacterium]